VSVHGSLRFQSPEPQETPLGQNKREAVRPKQPRPESPAGMGLDHEPKESSLQPGLQQDDQGLLGADLGDVDRNRQLGVGVRDKRVEVAHEVLVSPTALLAYAACLR